MVVLDTDVVSELTRAAPDPGVLSCLDDLPARGLFLTSVTEAEIRTGIAHLPEGARRRSLADAAERTLGVPFAGRVLPFESGAARAYADIAASCHAAGRPISHADCQIAAIAVSRGMAVETRNVRDFSRTGAEVLDPWAAA
ncbi:MAG: type II toxin-antitoxin system VapC family toxin [Defluviicoccus sp.]|nr:type II toxin-antitoxin system VapC family toxin [Defluviicoccus sp.]MDE0385341.1 type II toxin-antitoxin system VapC family toxin [Defluviicoccus sp.]